MDSSTVQNRLKMIVEKFGLSNQKFEKICGFSNGYINNAPKTISNKVQSSILEKFPNINKVWLLTGEGDMLTGVSQKNVSGDNIAGNTVTVNKAEFDKLFELLSNTQQQLNKSQEQVDRLIGLLEKK